MKKALFLLLCITILSMQDSGYRQLNGIAFPNATFMTTDPIGNVYVVTDNQLLRFDPAGKPVQNYSDVTMGELRMVDATNPMKVLLYYPDMARIVSLGTQFSPQSIIELRNNGFIQPTLICNSMNEGYWIYELQDFQLKKIDLNLQPVFQSGDLIQITGQRIIPNFLTEYNHRIYLNDPSVGILVFDQFGSYFKTIPIKGLRNFQIRENELIYSDGKSIHAYELKRLTERELPAPPVQKIRSLRYAGNQLYLLTSDSLNIYSF